ncbi:hypothetical protein [Maricaulis sp.]|uniref:hypothetical protein n=1 Tax=Maricaulis sp. TaxID=1486257 RepID=UPI003A906CD4
MMELKAAKNRIETSNLPEPVRSASRQLADWLTNLPEAEGRFLTFSHISERYAEAFKEEELLAALSLLARSDFAILEVSGYLDDHDEGPMLLSPSEYREAMASGVLVHPETGDDLGNPADFLHLYFALRS